MKANSRRRVLISSMAMLLVALVALGTATYAWFTSSTAISASGINVRTSKSSKLQISTADGDWSSADITYTGFKSVMVPASSGDGASWYTTNAAKSTEYGSGTNAITAASGTNYVYKEQLNIHNAGEADINNVKITFSLSHNYARIALVPVSAKGSTVTNSAEDFRANVYADSAFTYTPVVGGKIGGDDAEKPITITTKAAGEITVPLGDDGVLKGGANDSGESVYYNLYVWFEGQDEQCFDTNAGTGTGNISFSITGDTVSEAN